jgi:hypothetical protein
LLRNQGTSPFVFQSSATSWSFVMSTVQFVIIPKGEGWAIETNGDIGGDYVTREAAFEAIVGEASNAIRNGEAVEIIVNKPATLTKEQA